MPLGLGPSELAALLSSWQRRRDSVCCCLASHCLVARDYPAALQWLQQLLRYRPTDAALLSKYGSVRLLLGDVSGAKAAFGLVETLLVGARKRARGGRWVEGGGEGKGVMGDGAVTVEGGEGGGEGEGVLDPEVRRLQRLVWLNSALVLFAQKKYAEALPLYDQVLGLDATDAEAINNKVG